MGGEEHPDGHCVVDDAHLVMVVVMVMMLWMMQTRLVARARCTVSGWEGTWRWSSSRTKKIRLR